MEHKTLANVTQPFPRHSQVLVYRQNILLEAVHNGACWKNIEVTTLYFSDCLHQNPAITYVSSTSMQVVTSIAKSKNME